MDLVRDKLPLVILLLKSLAEKFLFRLKRVQSFSTFGNVGYDAADPGDRATSVLNGKLDGD